MAEYRCLNPAMYFTNKPVLLICLLSLVTGVLWLGVRDFSSRGEAREALAAQSVYAGNWIVPKGYGNVVASKPPLLHWLAAIFSLPSGKVTPFTSRLPSALSALAFALGFFFFLQQRQGRRAALLSVLLLMASVEWYRNSLDCRVDMLHSALLAASLCALYAWYERGLAGIPSFAILFMWGATLAKGPVGVVLPLLCFAAFIFLERRRRSVLGRTVLVVLLPAMLLSSIWYVLAAFHGGQEFLDRVGYENVARFTRSMDDEPHKHGILYLLGTLVLGLLPWITVFLPWFVQRQLIPLTSSLYASIRSTPTSFRFLRVRLRLQRKTAIARDRLAEWFEAKGSLERFSWVVIACIVLFYSIPSSKRSVYLLAAYPFVAFLFAQRVFRMGILERRTARKAFNILCGALLVAYLFLLLAASGRIALPGLSEEAHSFGVDFLQLLLSSSVPAFIVLLLPAILSGVFLFPGLLRGRDSFIAATLILCFSIYTSFGAVIQPAFARALSPRTFSAEVSVILRGKELSSFGNEFYPIAFYLGRSMGTKTDGFREGMYLVLYEKRLGELRALIAPRLEARVLLRSSGSIMKPGLHAVLVQIRTSRGPVQ